MYDLYSINLVSYVNEGNAASVAGGRQTQPSASPSDGIQAQSEDHAWK